MDKRNKIKSVSIDISSTLLQAIKQMDDVEIKLLLVLDQGKFASLISIGDIQRAIIANRAFSTSISEVLRDDIMVSYTNESKKAIKQKMIKDRTEFMPILNEHNDIADVIFWNDIFKVSFVNSQNGHLKLPVVIMAGGKGTRLKPITNIIPKPLIPLGDKTIVEIIIERFRKMGANHFYFSVNYKSEMIKNYFDEISNKDYQIEYFEEEKPLGTAGSLFLLKGQIKDTFFVTNCDILIEQDYEEVYKYHFENNNELTVLAALKNYSIPYGTLEIEENGLLKNLIEKPELTFMVNTGMYILEPHLLDEIPPNQFFHITHLMDQIKARGGKVGVFPVSEKSWMDIGAWKEYRETLKHFDSNATF